jgi:secondary thiamine-phosphate synthase enzyme
LTHADARHFRPTRRLEDDMHTLATSPIGPRVLSAAPDDTLCHALLPVTTRRPTEFVDITDRIDAFVGRRISSGIVNIQSLHTTTAIVVNEHEPLLLEDFERMLERSAPRGGYRHDDSAVRTANLTPGERVNGHAHCRALLLSASLGLNVVGGRLMLGRWQRVFFVELDGPQERQVSAMVVGSR